MRGGAYMSETANYKLYITDDSGEKFLNWREKMNGTADSNMIKIDAALSKKANNSVIVNSTLIGSAWEGTAPPFTQELLIDGLTDTQNGMISMSQSATAEEREMVREATLTVIGQENGKLIIAADGKKPEADIPVSIILLD